MTTSSGRSRRVTRAQACPTIPTGKSRRVEAKLRWIEKADRDSNELAADVLVDVVGVADVPLLMGEARLRQDVSIHRIRCDVIVRIPERVARVLDRVPPEPPRVHLAGRPRERDAARDVAGSIGKLAEPVLHAVVSRVEERVHVGWSERIGALHGAPQRGEHVSPETQGAAEVALVGLAADLLRIVLELTLGRDGKVRNGERVVGHDARRHTTPVPAASALK